MLGNSPRLLCFLIFSVVWISGSPQSYLRTDDGREYRDSHGYYRYVRGAKMYVECHDKYYDPRREDCGSAGFRSRNDEEDRFVGVDYNTGTGRYKMFGRIHDNQYYSTSDVNRYYAPPSDNVNRYRDRYASSGSGSTCPYSNYEGDRETFSSHTAALTRPEPLPLDDAVVISGKSAIRQARIFLPGPTLETTLKVKGEDKITDEHPEMNTTHNEVSKEKIRPKRHTRYYPNNDITRYYDRNFYDSNRRRYETTRYADCPGREKCDWEAELSCDLSSQLDTRYYQNYNTRKPVIRWTRIFDSHYPRGRFNNVLDYFGSRAYMKADGETLVITKVHPEDKGTYICEIEDGDRYRTSRDRFVRKEIRFYPRYPDYRGC